MAICHLSFSLLHSAIACLSETWSICHGCPVTHCALDLLKIRCVIGLIRNIINARLSLASTFNIKCCGSWRYCFNLSYPLLIFPSFIFLKFMIQWINKSILVANCYSETQWQVCANVYHFLLCSIGYYCLP